VAGRWPIASIGWLPSLLPRATRSERRACLVRLRCSGGPAERSVTRQTSLCTNAMWPACAPNLTRTL
jgi:hypothetical protein